MDNSDSIHVKNRHTKCILTAVLLLIILLAGTAWLGYISPALLGVYGIPTATFRLNWLIAPVVLAILGSIFVAARTDTIPERRKCYWIVGMVLLFPLSLVALAIRVLWK